MWMPASEYAHIDKTFLCSISRDTCLHSVYSFGLLMLEVVNQGVVWKHKLSHSEDMLLEQIIRGTACTAPVCSDYGGTLQQLVDACTHTEHTSRPTWKDIISAIETHAQAVCIE